MTNWGLNVRATKQVPHAHRMDHKIDLDFSDRHDIATTVFNGLPSEGHFHLLISPRLPTETEPELMLSFSEGQTRTLKARLDQALRTHEYNLRKVQEGRA